MPGPIDSMGPGLKIAIPNLLDVPTPTGPIPTPIPNIGMTPMTTGGVMEILHNFLPGLNILSTQPISVSAPFPGTVSKGALGTVKPMKGSVAVFYKNMPCTTLGDATMNDTVNSAGVTVGPSQFRVHAGK
jgi:hypothetical protein